MKRIQYYNIITGPRQTQRRKAEFVIPGDYANRIIIKTHLSLVSPGTELAFFEGTHTDLKTGKRKYPTGSGYSSVGVVEDAGKNVSGVKPGDLVMAMSGHIRYGCPNVFTKIPEGLDEEKAIFGVLGAIALHGVRDINPQIGQNVLISGLGAIGQIATRLCRITGIDKLVGLDLYPFRLEMALRGGADHSLSIQDPELSETFMEITSGRGFDTVIEASGNPAAILSALKYTAPRGKILVLGCPHGTVGVDFYRELQKKEISISGSYQPNCPDEENSYYPWSKRRNREFIMQYQLDGKLDFSPLITHRGPISQAQKFYEMLSEDKNRCITAVFDWSEKDGKKRCKKQGALVV